MNFNVYLLQSVFNLINSKYNDGSLINWGLLNRYNIIAFICALVSFVLCYWNKKCRLSSLLYALPISGLFSETIGVGMFLFNNHTFLGQFIFDLLSFIILGHLFYKKSNNKLLYIITVIIVSSIGYYLIYRPFL